MEARLLAGQGDAAIAKASGTHASIIRRYEQLFFHVRDRLQVEDWILQVVLCPVLKKGPHPAVTAAAHHRRLLYKLAGYSGGVEALEQVFAGLRRLKGQASAERGSWCERALFQTLRFKGLQAARLVEVTPKNALAIAGLTLRLMEYDQRERIAAERNGDPAPSPLLDVMQDVFTHTKLMLGHNAFENMSPQLKQVLESPVEPRLRDMAGSQDPNWIFPQRQAQTEAELRVQRSGDQPGVEKPAGGS